MTWCQHHSVAEAYVMGFGAPTYSGGSGGNAAPAGYGMGWPDYRSYTGYTMAPVMGVVNTLTETLVKEAEEYDKNDNPEHTAVSYLKEAKACINEGLKDCYKKYEVVDESLDVEDESELYEEFDAAAKTQVVKDRTARNQKSMEMAKIKGDKEGDKMYKIKLQIDQLDLQKTKLKGDVAKIQSARQAQREKIKAIAK
jgi:hypothetical protein